MQYKLGFLGAGNMAEAIAKAGIERGAVEASGVIASDPSEARRDVFAKMGVTVTDDNAQVLAQAEQILLAVKPQMLPNVVPDLAKHSTDERVLLSIMAGIRSVKLNDAIVAAGGVRHRVIRIMPNTPMMVGCGMSGIAVGDGARDGDDALAMKLFGAGGKAITVGEDLIDSVSAISGSGPAYVFYLAEAMEQAAAQLGLAEHAHTLVTQTILGAAQLMMQSDDPPAELRRKVTSPRGTTEAAIKHLDGNKSVEVIINAIKAAEKRGKELGA